jgi:hypothetical protein
MIEVARAPTSRHWLGNGTLPSGLICRRRALREKQIDELRLVGDAFFVEGDQRLLRIGGQRL